MITLQTDLGRIRLNKFTKNHARQNRHPNPEDNKQLLEALASDRFKVVDEIKSGWRGKPVKNLVLLVETATKLFLVVLKEISNADLLMVTAYIPRDKQLRKYQVA